MIQRIQTVFWLLAAVLMIMAIFMPWMSFVTDKGDFFLNAKGIQAMVDGNLTTVVTGLPLLIYVVICAGLNIFAISQYKNRMLQMRISIITALLELLTYTLILMYRLLGFEGEIANSNKYVAIIFPLLAGILTYMAFKGVQKDDAKIRSLDRIR